MPNTVDTIAVPRDITLITSETGVLVKDIKYDGPQKLVVGEAVSSPIGGNPDVHIFSLSVEGSYSQIKKLLTDFEQNAYPIEVHELKISAQKEGGFLSASMKLYTYNRALPTKEVSTL
jgi:hypothetical protein